MDDEHGAVWADTTDGGLLKDLFGYWPTMHDAVVRSLHIRRADDMVEMVVDYTDQAEGGESMKARILLRWGGVRSLDIDLHEPNLSALDFRREGDDILSLLDTFSGRDGRIVSETFEAILMQVKPRPEDEPARLRYE